MESQIENIVQYYNAERDHQFMVNRQLGWVHVHYRGWFDRDDPDDGEIVVSAAFPLNVYRPGIEHLVERGSCCVEFGQSSMRISSEEDGVMVSVSGAVEGIDGYRFPVKPEDFRLPQGYTVEGRLDFFDDENDDYLWSEDRSYQVRARTPDQAIQQAHKRVKETVTAYLTPKKVLDEDGKVVFEGK